MPTSPKTSEYYKELQELIAQKEGYGPIEDWKHSQFVKLSEHIEQTTGDKVSVSTLKRLFGKVKYKGKANISTYDTLSRYVDYDNWSHFVSSLNEGEEKETTGSFSSDRAGPEFNRFLVVAVLVLFLALVVMSYFLFFVDGKEVQTGKAKIVLSSKVVEVPETITIGVEYLSEPFPAVLDIISDKVTIEESTTDILKTVGKPGIRVFALKDLAGTIIDTAVIKGIDSSWQGFLMYRKFQNMRYTPVMLDRDINMTESGTMRIPEHIYTTYDVNSSYFYWSSFTLCKPFNIQIDDMAFEYRARNYTSDNLSEMFSKDIHIKLLSNNGSMVRLNFYKQGYAAWAYNQISDVVLSEDKEAQELLSLNTDAWNTIKGTIKNKKLKLYVNDTFLLEQSYTEPLGTLGSVSLNFRGKGEVDYIKVWSEDRTIIDDEF